jgi:cystathionine beta-lyase/cystathionine gamma-synthase
LPYALKKGQTKLFNMITATQLMHSIHVNEQTSTIAVPMYATSTFVQDAPSINKGFDYARTANPFVGWAELQEAKDLIADLAQLLDKLVP